MIDKKYYKNINTIRVLACVAVLLYHLNILKGGYLAVCIFFVLSGYLSCVSANKKEKFSLVSYYSNRLIKLYLPLITIVFVTIFLTSLCNDIKWLNLKPEATSVLVGYNNFWQLDANLDYFARHINSPFMHLWYISILLQFDLVFPIIYIILRKIGDKVSRIIPIIITMFLSIIFTIYFYKMSLTQNIMLTYYNTFTRVFSLLFGLSLGFIHSYYGSLVPNFFKKNYISKIIFFTYILILFFLFIFIDAKSVCFPISMVLTTIIGCRLIDYGIINIKNNLSIFDKIVKSLSGISYELYLLQYPIIFLFQKISINSSLEIFIIIILLIILSYIFHYCLNFNKKYKIIKCILRVVILTVSLFGLSKYIQAKDYTDEMKKLEEQLLQNQQIIERKQEEYQLIQKEEQENWISILTNLENEETGLKDIVTNLSVVGIGDSVMLGAVGELYDKFPNGYFDAQISRTAWVAEDILRNLRNRNILGEPIILNLGSNGDCSLECKRKIIETCEDSNIFWINVTNDEDVNVNDELKFLESEYANLYIIDWNFTSKNHPEYFLQDGIHLTKVGKEAYTNLIYDSIYDVYLKEYIIQKEEIIKKHEEELKTKISFYGNSTLLNAFDYMQNSFSTSKFVINKEFDYQMLINEIQKSKEENSLTYKLVFIFDNNVNLSLEDYYKLITLCEENKIYILCTSENAFITLNNIDNENIIIINFYQEIENNKYLMVDGIHLSKEGNIALSKILESYLK